MEAFWEWRAFGNRRMTWAAEHHVLAALDRPATIRGSILDFRMPMHNRLSDGQRLLLDNPS